MKSKLLAKISFLKCKDYNSRKLSKKVRELLEPFESELEKIKRGDKVLLKPNLLSAHKPEDAVTTHPEFLKAVLRVFLDLGAKVFIGDSPSPGVRKMEKLFDITGLSEIEKEFNVKLASFDNTGWCKKSIGGKDYPIAKIICDADFVVNLPKIKTHNLTLLTLGVKNMYGSIPGFKKALLHRDYPNPIAFSEMNLDVYMLANPNLTIYDGIVGMEGDGPAAGEAVNLGFIAATDDAITCDMFITELLGVRKEIFPLYLAGLRKGLSMNREYSLFGDAVETYISKEIKLPRTNQLSFIPPIVVKILGKQLWARPRILTAKCRNCGKCVSVCPANAIEEGGARPYFVYRKCISCFCCIETCPYNAMEVRVSPLVRLAHIL